MSNDINPEEGRAKLAKAIAEATRPAPTSDLKLVSPQVRFRTNVELLKAAMRVDSRRTSSLPSTPPPRVPTEAEIKAQARREKRAAKKLDNIWKSVAGNPIE